MHNIFGGKILKICTYIMFLFVINKYGWDFKRPNDWKCFILSMIHARHFQNWEMCYPIYHGYSIKSIVV